MKEKKMHAFCTLLIKTEYFVLFRNVEFCTLHFWYWDPASHSSHPAPKALW